MHRFRSIKLKYLLALLLMVGLFGCSPNQTKEYNAELSKLLPEVVGYTWVYEGFAEYNHVMTLNEIIVVGDGYRYSINGTVADVSGGESPHDLTFTVQYIIKDGVLIQEKVEEVMLDSIFDNLELIHAPVQLGTSWTQDQTDKDGNIRTLSCQITGVRMEGGATIYTVLYQDMSSDYYEKREIKTGVGIIRVETLWMTEEGNFPLEYYLFQGIDPNVFT